MPNVLVHVKQLDGRTESIMNVDLTDFSIDTCAQFIEGYGDEPHAATDEATAFVRVEDNVLEYTNQEWPGYPLKLLYTFILIPQPEEDPVRTDGSDWLDYAVTPAERAKRAAHFAASDREPT